MLGPYGALLRVSGAFSFSSMGFLARMPISMTGLGAVLLIAGETGRYGIAGVIAGVLALSFAIISPQVARLVDRFGQARVLRPTVLLFGAAGVGFVVAVELGAPLWTWFLLAALTGASGPNIGSMVRARWVNVLENPTTRQTAFAFESVVDEIVFVIGPPLVTFLATAISPPVGFLTAVIIGLIGGMGFATLTSSEPPVARTEGIGRGRRGVLNPALLSVTITYVGVGTVFGAMDVGVVAYADEQGQIGLSGVILAVYAAGSLVAGLAYGAVAWRRGLAGRFLLTTLAFGVAASGFLLVNSLLVLAGLAFLAGATIAPVLVSGMSLVESRLPRAALTEGLAWTTTGITVGVTIGASISGSVVDAIGAEKSFIVQVVGAGSAAVLAALGYVAVRRTDRRSDRTADGTADPTATSTAGAVADGPP
ncbi:MAG: MFS transporter [Geodermatophilaceae bacterium]|nr:MFS transporter [Geodermatophilaceae bacterium]MDQ3475820.1 MFS transporter [Actinomycetota bacterium]